MPRHLDPTLRIPTRKSCARSRIGTEFQSTIIYGAAKIGNPILTHIPLGIFFADPSHFLSFVQFFAFSVDELANGFKAVFPAIQSSSTPGAKLDVAGDAYVTGVGTTNKLNLYVKQSAANGGLMLEANGGKQWHQSVLGNDYQFTESGVASVMTLKAGGNVGIGTSVPGSKLSVYNAANGGTSTDGLANSILYLNNGSSADGSIVIKTHSGSMATGTSVGALKFQGSPDGVNYSSAAIKALTNGAAGRVGALAFYTSNTSNSQADVPDEVMRMVNGNVGIGTTTPASKLDVNGSVKVGADATACSSTIQGSIHLNGTSLEYCNGTSWATLSTSSLGSYSFSGITMTTSTGSSMTLTPGAAGTATASGNTLSLQGGVGGSTSGNGGTVTINGGNPITGAGGAVNISGANGVGTNQNGGSVTITSGNATGSGTPGVIALMGGNVGIGTTSRAKS